MPTPTSPDRRFPNGLPGSPPGGLARRKFLGASAAVALGSFGPRLPAWPVATGSEDERRFERSGIFWFGPSFFDHCTGPWQPRAPAGADVVATWKRAIDWFADHGLNLIVIQLGPNFGTDAPSPVVGADSIRFGWGYHYVLDFERFPEARVFERDVIRRNQDVVRAITEHGRERGVEVFTHHYNFFCPLPFVRAHPELARLEMGQRGKFIEIKPPVWDLRRNLAQDVCWNVPVYREFLTACLSEYLALFPAAAGILVTPGERARCQCVHCIGEQPDAAHAKAARFQDRPERRKTFASFVETFDKTVRAAGRKPLVRGWIAGLNPGWIAELPKNVTYVTKYSVFDLTDGGPDAEIEAWKAAGHDTWFLLEHTGNENAGPLVMTVPEACDTVAERSLAAGVTNMIGMVNCEHGLTYERSHVQDLHTVLFANAFGKRTGTGRAAALAHYRALFGEHAAAALDAARDLSEPAWQITRVIFNPTEGFTWYQAPHLAAIGGVEPGFPGTLESSTPPAWAAREIVTLRTYLTHLKTHAWTRTLRKELTGSGTDPIEHLAAATERARRGSKALDELAPKVPAAARAELALLRASARVAVGTGEHYTQLMEAAFWRAAALSPAALAERQHCARKAVEAQTAVVAAVRRVIEACRELPGEVIDEELLFNRLLGAPDPAPAAGKPGGPRRGGHLALRETELARLREELQPLLAS